MCGRYACDLPWSAIAELFGVADGGGEEPEEFRRRKNASPRNKLPVIRYEPGRGRRQDLLEWGLLPSWAKPDEFQRKRFINARDRDASDPNKNISNSRAFGPAFARRRCLVPATAFYEWMDGPTAKAPRQPYAIRMEDFSPFAMAGIWEGWKDPVTGVWTHTFAIITTDPNRLMARIHDRMPVIVHPVNWAKWLGEEPATVDELMSLLQPWPDYGLVAYPVSTRLNKPGTEDDAMLDPVGPQLDPQADG